MNKQNSKKLNNHQKLIALIALAVAVLLAVCVTFAWYTNRINTMNGTVTLGQFNYTVTLFDVNGTSATQEGKKSYTDDKTDTSTYENASIDLANWANNSTHYQIVKIKNSSGFGIKAYEYLTFGELTAQQKSLANYCYFKAFKMNGNSDQFPSFSGGDLEASDLSDYLAQHSDELPGVEKIASVDSDTTFGSINNNAVALGGVVDNNTTNYYLLAYCLKGTSINTLITGGSFEFTPVVAIAQANGPVPQQTDTTKTIYVSSWQELKTAISGAGDGDTIYLLRNIESPANTHLSINKAVNLNLNGKNLKIHGDFVYRVNTANSRTLTVPLASNFFIDGNMYIESLGSVVINGVGGSKNIYLGKEDNGNVSGGSFYADCGLYVDEGDFTDLLDDVIDENSGLVINNLTVQTMTSGGTYEDATLSVVSSNSMIKIGAGSKLNAIITPTENGHQVNHIYIVNYGEVNSLNLANVIYPSTDEYQVGLYLKNYNTVGALSISAAAKGYKTEGDSNFNTRIIDGDGAAVSFKSLSPNPFTSTFKSSDVEPHNTEAVEKSYVKKLGDVYTVYLRDTAKNTELLAESISDLFDDAGYTLADCQNLKIVTQNGIVLIPDHFAEIRTIFTSLKSVDLSGSALKKTTINGNEVPTIPDNAFYAANSSAPTAGLNSVTFPVTTFAVGENAFAGTSIESLTLESNVSSLGSGAFDVRNKLEVMWNKSTDIDKDAILPGFNVNKTTIFMDEALAKRAIDDTITKDNAYYYSDVWKLNMYEFYDFKSGDYYCKNSREGSTGCEIIYYAGNISDTFDSASDKNLVPLQLSDPVTNTNLDVVTVKRQAFKKAISDNGKASTIVINLSNCLTVEESAFEGELQVSELSLGKVNKIGKNAFKNNIVTFSAARPTGSDGFAGMTSIDSYAFNGCKIAGGILDLHGPSSKYYPSNNALAGLTIYGDYGNGNAVLDLTNAGTIPAQFAVGANIRADLVLKNVDSIAAGAFANAIKSNQSEGNTPTNSVDIRDVKSISTAAFNGIVCGTFRIGTHDDSRIDVVSPYTNIIGSGTIERMILDGTFGTGDELYAIASADASNQLTINYLEIAPYEVDDVLQKTLIPTNAFACDTSSHNLIIKHLVIGNTTNTVTNTETGEDEEEFDSYASYDIGNKAFKGVSFPTAGTAESPVYYNFNGVVNIGEQAFADSTIQYLGLGSKIATIADENFILHCDLIKNLRIERTDTMVVLEGNSAADPAFSTSGNTLSNFEISVNSQLLTAYVQDDVWSGWKNYFGALYYTDYTTIDGAFASSGQCIRWYYNVIDPDNPGKGIQLIKSETYNLTTNQADVLKYKTSTRTQTPYGRFNVYGYRIVIPKELHYNGGTLAVTEIGDADDLFEGVVPGPASVNATYNAANPTPKFEVYLGTVTNLNYVSPISLSSENILKLSVSSTTDTKYFVDTSGLQLFYRQTSTSSGADAYNELVKVLPSYTNTAYTVPKEVVIIQSGAFEGCTGITELNLQAGTSATDTNKLKHISENAFSDSMKTFDFTNTRNFITIGKDVFGPARERQVSSDGYYSYKTAQNPPTIIIPNSTTLTDVQNLNSRYKNSIMYYFYYTYGCMQDANVTTAYSVEKTQSQSKLGLKNTESDTVLSGIQYHLMNSGSEYEGTKYTSDSSQMIAVVTGLNSQAAASKQLVIPATVVVKGVSYEVVAIADNAFGSNTILETLVLPGKSVRYSSNALAGCIKLGTIQYSDVLSLMENNADVVAAMPAPSAQSLVESSNEDEN